MKKSILTIILGLTITLAYSQNTNNELLKKLVEKEILTQEEANEVAEEEEINNSSAKAVKGNIGSIKDALSTPYLQLGGYALLHHSYSNVSNIEHNTSVRAAFLSIKGEPVTNLKYLVFANLRNPSLTEYYIDWTPYRALQFRAGQHKVPISIENQLSLTALEFIQNTRTVDYLVGGGNDVLTIQNGNNSSGRDIGIKAYGSLFEMNEHNFVQYDIGIYQGSGINAGAKTNNKDFSASILLSPFKNLRIGGGAHFGEAVYGVEGLMPESKHTRNRWLVSADYKTDRFTARTEWIRGKDSSMEKEGIYGMGTWFFVPNKWLLLGRIDYYNNNKEVAREVFDYSGGVNYHITKTCRIQINYTYSDYSRVWGDRNSHLVEAQFQVVY